MFPGESEKRLGDSVSPSPVAIPPHRVDGWGIPLRRVEVMQQQPMRWGGCQRSQGQGSRSAAGHSLSTDQSRCRNTTTPSLLTATTVNQSLDQVTCRKEESAPMYRTWSSIFTMFARPTKQPWRHSECRCLAARLQTVYPLTPTGQRRCQ
jgi:hypothetical protein